MGWAELGGSQAEGETLGADRVGEQALTRACEVDQLRKQGFDRQSIKRLAEGMLEDDLIGTRMGREGDVHLLVGE